MKRVPLTNGFTPPGEGWILVGDYDPRSPNYMRWFWERVESAQMRLA